MVTFWAPRRVEIGAGMLNRAGDLVKSLGGKKVLIVTTPLPDASIGQGLENSLGEAGIQFKVFNGITGEPTSDNVQEGFEMATFSKCDCVVALGGGSVIDTAKASGGKNSQPPIGAGRYSPTNKAESIAVDCHSHYRRNWF